MKNLLTIIVLLSFLVACEEEDPGLPTECVEVSLVTTMCGQAVMKIQDPNYFYLGESANGEKNVFFTFLHCDDMYINPEENFFIEFLSEQDDKGSCAVCLAILAYNGDKSYDVRVRTNCD